MEDNSLIELFEELTDSENDDEKLHILVKRCCTASSSELEDFINELSELSCYSFELYIPFLKAFLSQLLKYSKRPTLLTKYTSAFQKFPSLLIKYVVMQNLHQCDIPGFGELFDHCLELLWQAQNKITIQTTKDILDKILDSDSILRVLVSRSHGRHCLKRVMSELSKNNRITEKETLLKAVDMVAAIVEECSEHKNISPWLSEALSVYKACSALLDKFRLNECLCDNDESHFTLLGMSVPKNSPDVHYMHAFEQRKLNLFQALIKFSPCISCQKQALIRFSPDKYSSYVEEELTNFQNSKLVFRLPFELDEDDKLGPWNILISEDAIKDMAHLKIPQNLQKIKAVLKKLGNISFGAWDKLELKLIIPSLSIHVYETEPHDHSGLKILLQVNYSPFIDNYPFSKLVKVWAVTTDQERIDKLLEYLAMLHQVYTICRCTIQQVDEKLKSTEKEPCSCQIDDEILLEIHKMLVAGKFIPLSKRLLKPLVMRRTDFTFQVSEIEYDIINNHNSAIIIGRSGTGKTTCIMYRLIASYLNNSYYTYDDMPITYKRQVFITVSHHLCRRIKECFKRLQKSAALAERKMSEAQFYEYAKKREEEDFDNDLVDNNMVEEDEDNDLNDIPNSFYHLTKDHFPLYWERFNDKKLDHELVYSEFSIIKGSNSEGKYLSREEYQAISTKKYPVFCHIRDKIYDLFQRYEKMKARNGDYDLIDRTIAILRCAMKKTFRGSHIHEVYIDECQDNQIADFGLILKIFDRVDSIFLAGDTAQCIAKGSSFRFEDIRALMHKWELERIQTNNNIFRDTMEPNRFELNVNYRSHNGILRLAASIIDLILEFFPKTIDRLSRERSEVGGPQPIVFKGFQSETFHLKLFSAGENPENYIEFGAEQVIIVRDENSKSRVEDLIGKKGLVLTVFEAKGMEFNDVLLYNFFTDSPGGLKWRVILSALGNQSEGVQTFSHEKHYILSSELKHLYVAVTRARQHIWIFDENDQYIEPICKYWERNGLVKVIHSEDETNSFPTLARTSSSAEWNREGNKFFESRKYKQAIFCYEKSGNDEKLARAKAYHLRQKARASINDSDWDTVILNFYRAADAFRECSRPIQEASCYEDINMYEKAAEIYLGGSMFEHAACCYLKISNFEYAGKYFEMASKYTEAVLAYKDGRYYENVLNLMQSHREKIDKKIFNRIIRLVNIHYRRVNNKKMSEKALSVLPTQEEQNNLLRDHAPEELQEIYKKNGKFRDAAEDLRFRGKFNEAIDTFLQSDNDEDIIEALQCCLYLCRVKVLKITMINFGRLNDSPEDLIDLNDQLSKAINIDTQSLKRSEELRNLGEELRLYSAYLNSDLDGIRKFMKLFRSREDRVNEFRAVTIWLDMSKDKIKAENWRERLHCLLRICELAFPFLAPRGNENLTKINKEFQNVFVVNEVENRPQKRKISSDNHLIHLLNQTNAEISENWDEANLYGRQIQDISSKICFNFTSCTNQYCRKHHVVPTPSILLKRFELACLQIDVMQQLNVLYSRRLLKEQQSKTVCGAQRWWAERLVRFHIRYQSPQTSCPEVTYTMLAKLSKHTRSRLINLCQVLLSEMHENDFDFSIMLKCILVLHQLRDYWWIDEFNWKMSRRITLRHRKQLPIGYAYYHRYEAVPVGEKLTKFFSNLYANRVLDAIQHIEIFIQYAINNAKLVKINTPDAFCDLISLMEFKTSLVFAAAPGIAIFVFLELI
ncbi:4901_t:CDS:10 [Ambispora leptoticha]|uniref:4901_t:CDS:1 n=1 Tax=Ambispora leptoticha TaxID=144679 RepID=A0A9N9ALX6_9GLOM|nr:4901_t:CDS:10 [Ambispora leptoticha]